MNIVSTARKKLRQYRSHAVIATGQEKHSGEPLRMLLLGRGIDRNYILQRAFRPGFEESGAKGRWLFELPGLIDRTRADLVVACDAAARNGWFSGERGFFLPRWIGGGVRLDDALSLLKTSDNVKADLARIRKYKLSFEVSNDPVRYRWFHERMYAPYIASVYGKAGAIASLKEVEASVGRSLLMFVLRDGEPISGQILLFEGDTARGWALGVLDGRRELTKVGAVSALYVFGIQAMAERGFKYLSFGGSRPFVDDGVLQFKKKWRIVIRQASPTGFLISHFRDCSGARAFVDNNPFIHQQPGGELRAAVFVSDPRRLDVDRLRETLRKCQLKGLASVDLYDTDLDLQAVGLEQELTAELRRLPLANVGLAVVR
jgi:hypothetical protein